MSKSKEQIVLDVPLSPEAHAELIRGLESAKNEQIQYLGDFTQYIDDDFEDEAWDKPKSNFNNLKIYMIAVGYIISFIIFCWLLIYFLY